MDFLYSTPVWLGIVACHLLIFSNSLAMRFTTGSVFLSRQLLYFVLLRKSRMNFAGVTSKRLAPRKYHSTVFASEAWYFLNRSVFFVFLVDLLNAAWTTSSDFHYLLYRSFAKQDRWTTSRWRCSLCGHFTANLRSRLENLLVACQRRLFRLTYHSLSNLSFSGVVISLGVLPTSWLLKLLKEIDAAGANI